MLLGAVAIVAGLVVHLAIRARDAGAAPA
jgi:hypothetical protein